MTSPFYGATTEAERARPVRFHVNTTSPPLARLEHRWRRILCLYWSGCDVHGRGEHEAGAPRICRWCLRVPRERSLSERIAYEQRGRSVSDRVADLEWTASYARRRRERFDAAISEAAARDLAAAGVVLGGKNESEAR